MYLKLLLCIIGVKLFFIATKLMSKVRVDARLMKQLTTKEEGLLRRFEMVEKYSSIMVDQNDGYVGAQSVRCTLVRFFSSQLMSAFLKRWTNLGRWCLMYVVIALFRGRIQFVCSLFQLRDRVWTLWSKGASAVAVRLREETNRRVFGCRNGWK